MKYLIFIFCSIYFPNASQAQLCKLKNMNFIPAGTYENPNDTPAKRLSLSAFYMSEEITNKEYKIFINDLLNHPDDSILIVDLASAKKVHNRRDAMHVVYYRDMLQQAIDTNVWGANTNYNNYFIDATYDDFPVVGVTYNNAINFCRWKTKKQNDIYVKKGKDMQVYFRLPIELEWEYVASQEEVAFLSPLGKVKSGNKNSFGLHNLNNNVSEWVLNSSENNMHIIKGNSWKEERKFTEQRLVQSEYRDNACGFRIVCSYYAKHKK